MTRGSWASSGRKPATATRSTRGARPAGSWSAAIARAVEAWDALTGGPNVERDADVPAGAVRVMGPNDVVPPRLVYSDAAAAAILDTALGLWSDTAAAMGGEDADGDAPG